MQTANQVLASPLPRLRQARGTTHPSASNEWIHQRFIHPWATFNQEIQSALVSLDLNFQVDHIDSPGGEVYLVGNEIDLSGQFVNNVCDPVAKVLARTSQPEIVIGDIQAFETQTSDVFTDGSGHDYIEGSDFKAERLRGGHGVQASSCASRHRDHVIEASPANGGNPNITPNAIITDKAFFEIERQGKRYIVKCWSPRHDRASNAECGVYERLLDSRPSGYDVFANMILNGNILCSSLFPDGRALVLPHKDGKILAHIWDELSHRERIHIREECEKAIRILRSVSIYVPDSGKHNVLYARETGAVTMLDFESAIECPQSDHMPYVELTSLFGDGFMRGHTSGG
ncbi:hypothetical protein N7492_000285 [Penicillium capsulatum]|uniref:Protein kinase domain-containing protein n=1 Tax=Penicillium capsulatum TaxID=69766 RepID=A0A9W9IPB1_9EURO|nr:hypothetical protein N7492_000285 [Penicillium capsulatum]KAJ6130650.1 hypothetical protein N7512_003430 [Penicillium capsulatum]